MAHLVGAGDSGQVAAEVGPHGRHKRGDGVVGEVPAKRRAMKRPSIITDDLKTFLRGACESLQNAPRRYPPRTADTNAEVAAAGR